MTQVKPELGVAMIGYAFMGAAHSQGWRTAPRFFDLPLNPVMRVVAGRSQAGVTAAGAKLGWQETSTDWKSLLTRDDIDLIDICTPGDSHKEIALATLAAGKHVLCEKPLANSVAEAQEMADAAALAAKDGVIAMLGFTYRRVPAVQLAAKLVADGRLGEIRQVRAQYLQDWLSDENSPLSWRLDKDKAGSGALGDIAAHIIDMTQFITGQNITEVSGALKTFVAERPVATDFSGLSGVAGTERGPVTVDDAALFLANLSGGAIGIFEATRFALGRKNALRVEINGSLGSVSLDLEDMNVLNFFDATEPAETAGFRRIIVTEPEHAYVANWWPAGHGLGYEHAFTHQVVDLVAAIANGEQPLPSFADGLQVQKVLAAVEESSNTRAGWSAV